MVPTAGERPWEKVSTMRSVVSCTEASSFLALWSVGTLPHEAQNVTRLADIAGMAP
jgi:hypothetical protein